MTREKERIAGLVLAAGASTRMGEPKQLLTVGRKTLLDRALGEALISDLDCVVLVLGAHAREIMQGIKTDLGHPKLRIIENKKYLDGISTSIIAGLSEVEAVYDHVMIILADMPRITSDLINLLIHQYLASGLPLGAIKVKERRAHPVVVGRPFYDEVHRLKGDVGARALFATHSDQVCMIKPGEDYEDADIDTLQDYLEFKRSLSKGPESSGSQDL